MRARRPAVTALFLPLLLAAAATGQVAASPYLELADRPIKALSPEEIAGYLEGAGMGFALAAELNGYPGPKHLLELAHALELTEEQRDRVRAVHDRMAAAARSLGEELVAREADLDSAFAAGSIDAERLERLVAESADLRGGVRLAHLAAHLETKSLLTEAQIERYVELRGYAHGSPSGPTEEVPGHPGHGAGHPDHGGG